MLIRQPSFFRLVPVACVVCLTASSMEARSAEHGGAPAPAGHKKHWSYEGDTSPEHWGELSPAFKVCQLGLEQTPIDLSSGQKGEAGGLAFDYKQFPLRIINNGHTIQVNANAGSTLTIGDKRFNLLQFHFHHRSEHLVDGKPFDMEVHFVHKSEDGKLAVVGVLIKSGAHNAGLQAIFDQMPKSEGPEVAATSQFDPSSFFPGSQSYYRYMGSLTTPPCSEGLTWTVFRDPIEASPEQIRQFSTLFPNNARPVQSRNRRFLIETN